MNAQFQRCIRLFGKRCSELVMVNGVEGAHASLGDDQVQSREQWVHLLYLFLFLFDVECVTICWTWAPSLSTAANCGGGSLSICSVHPASVSIKFRVSRMRCCAPGCSRIKSGLATHSRSNSIVGSNSRSLRS